MELSCSLYIVALEQVEKRILGALKQGDQHGKQKFETLQAGEAESSMMGETKNQIAAPNSEMKKNDETDKSKNFQKKHQENDGVWTLRFNGSKLSKGSELDLS